MELLKSKILTEGIIKGDDILKVDAFLNHQLDYELLNEMGKSFYETFKDQNITKILTIEASGIAIAIIAAQYFKVPTVFAKKMESKNLDGDTYNTEVFSFTKAKNYTVKVSKKFIHKDDRVLILDDFLAMGRAALGLIDICNQAEASVVGVGIAIEKTFQEGAGLLMEKGIPLKSLARISRFENGKPVFED